MCVICSQCGHEIYCKHNIVVVATKKTFEGKEITHVIQDLPEHCPVDFHYISGCFGCQG